MKIIARRPMSVPRTRIPAALMALKIPRDAVSEPTTTETAPMIRQSRNAELDFRGQRRSNPMHAPSADPGARLYKKSSGAGPYSASLAMP